MQPGIPPASLPLSYTSQMFPSVLRPACYPHSNSQVIQTDLGTGETKPCTNEQQILMQHYNGGVFPQSRDSRAAAQRALGVAPHHRPQPSTLAPNGLQTSYPSLNGTQGLEKSAGLTGSHILPAEQVHPYMWTSQNIPHVDSSQRQAFYLSRGQQQPQQRSYDKQHYVPLQNQTQFPWHANMHEAQISNTVPSNIIATPNTTSMAPGMSVPFPLQPCYDRNIHSASHTASPIPPTLSSNTAQPHRYGHSVLQLPKQPAYYSATYNGHGISTSSRFTEKPIDHKIDDILESDYTDLQMNQMNRATIRLGMMAQGAQYVELAQRQLELLSNEKEVDARLDSFPISSDCRISFNRYILEYFNKLGYTELANSFQKLIEDDEKAASHSNIVSDDVKFEQYPAGPEVQDSQSANNPLEFGTPREKSPSSIIKSGTLTSPQQDTDTQIKVGIENQSGRPIKIGEVNSKRTASSPNLNSQAGDYGQLYKWYSILLNSTTHHIGMAGKSSSPIIVGPASASLISEVSSTGSSAKKRRISRKAPAIKKVAKKRNSKVQPSGFGQSAETSMVVATPLQPNDDPIPEPPSPPSLIFQSILESLGGATPIQFSPVMQQQETNLSHSLLAQDVDDWGDLSSDLFVSGDADFTFEFPDDLYYVPQRH